MIAYSALLQYAHHAQLVQLRHPQPWREDCSCELCSIQEFWFLVIVTIFEPCTDCHSMLYKLYTLPSVLVLLVKCQKEWLFATSSRCFPELLLWHWAGCNPKAAEHSGTEMVPQLPTCLQRPCFTHWRHMQAFPKKSIDGSSLKLIGRTWYISRGQFARINQISTYSEIHEIYFNYHQMEYHPYWSGWPWFVGFLSKTLARHWVARSGQASTCHALKVMKDCVPIQVWP